ncbi:MAG: hypothetical protein IJX17_04875 [Clostridia bacterium]|nr:hypothetical protein [Clostridia bacterium]
MKITNVYNKIKCDVVLCNDDAKFEFITNSYKGNSYLCENCFNAMKNTIKKVATKNETKSI